jgi:tRNA threonylcarbamoyladenosine biosynthesis protein TsaB
MILALKTASATTTIGLLDMTGQELVSKDWESGRNLAEGLLAQVFDLLRSRQADLSDLSGLIVFRGPGSFTSLRIGITTINALAYALVIPNVGVEGENWLEQGVKLLKSQNNPQIVTPFYDRGPNITKSRK